MIVNINSPMLASMIDRRKTATSPYCEEVPAGMVECERCGNLIGRNDTYYAIDGECFCEECELFVKEIIEDTLTEEFGTLPEHIYDDILEAVQKTY